MATYTLTCDMVSFTLSPQAVGLSASRKLVCDMVPFTFSPQDIEMYENPDYSGGGYYDLIIQDDIQDLFV